MEANEARRGQDRRKMLLLGTCALMMLALWALQVNPYLNAADDSGRYMVLGESLARSGSLRLLNDARHPLDTLYPPGFPLIIAFWLRVSGRDPGGVVLWVKFTQILLMIATLPLLSRLLERARLAFPTIAAALITFALCPATIAYANEVMSEAPFLFLLLASVVLVERKARLPSAATDFSDGPQQELQKEERPPRWQRLLALACAAAAFLVRTAGISLLLVLIGVFWKRFGWKWGVLAATITLLVVGGWQIRNRRIIQNHPNIHYTTYLDQFSYKDPDDPNAGRIQLNAIGLLGRVKRNFPTYIGMIPRAALYSMAPPRLALFYLVAVPFTLLVFAGFVVGWRRGLTLSGAFCALFWLFAAMWPWKSARFLVPLLPLLLLYLFLGVEQFATWFQRRAGLLPTRLALGTMALLLLAHFARVYQVTVPHERQAALPGYPLGRTRAEGGFYAACDWLKRNAEPNTIGMGRPAYLLHLYSDHPTTQIEPSENPRVQEKAYIVPQHVRYLVQDAWTWAHSDRYLNPYLRDYAAKWTLAWQDPLGSGVRVWRRTD